MWPDAAVQLLVSFYQEQRHHFKGSKSCIRHEFLWNQISQSMAQYLEKAPSGKQCKRMIDEMQAYFRKEFDAQSSTGREPSWEWFDTFYNMEKGSANLHAPCVYSVGSSTSYTQHGKAAQVQSRNSRSRPKPNIHSAGETEEEVDDPASKLQEDKKKPRTNQKEFAREMLIANLDVKKNLLVESRLSREAADKRGGDRASALLSIAESMKLLAKAVNPNVVNNNNE